MPAGSGKTLIAAEVIRNKLPALRQANKVAVFLAPTNPLTDQVSRIIIINPGLTVMHHARHASSIAHMLMITASLPCIPYVDMAKWLEMFGKRQAACEWG